MKAGLNTLEHPEEKKMSAPSRCKSARDGILVVCAIDKARSGLGGGLSRAICTAPFV